MKTKLSILKKIIKISMIVIGITITLYNAINYSNNSIIFSCLGLLLFSLGIFLMTYPIRKKKKILMALYCISIFWLVLDILCLIAFLLQ